MSAPGITLRPEWLDWPQTQLLIQALDAPLYFRGGALRDSLLGVLPGDIDLVVDRSRPEVVERLSRHGFTISPFGKSMVQAERNGIHYDALPSHPDRPNVASAVARTGGAVPGEITINSLYLSPSGEFLDYYGGVADLYARRVRLTGDPRERLMENAVCLIRFFRFHTLYGSGDPDPESVEAIMHYANRIPAIPPRLMDVNTFNLLSVPQLSGTLVFMHRIGILDRLFGFALRDCRRLATLEMLENMTQVKPDGHLRLCVLLCCASLPPLEGLARIRQPWGLPDDSYEWKYHLLTALPEVKPDMPVAMQEGLRERLGMYAYKQLLLLAWVMEPEPLAARAAYQSLLERGA